MSNKKWAAKVDSNQAGIVKALRAIPGTTVELNHDDILVGHKGRNYWYELKSPDQVNKAGQVRESAKKASQKRLEKEWRGHYRIVSSIDEILADLHSEG